MIAQLKGTPIMDAQIKDAFLALAEAHRTSTEVLSTLINEIGALRELLKQVNGEQFEHDLQEMQLKVMADTALIESANLRLCDELIERVKAF
jgi:hypothetical protein